jgi:hypothetical protein
MLSNEEAVSSISLEQVNSSEVLPVKGISESLRLSVKEMEGRVKRVILVATK